MKKKNILDLVTENKVGYKFQCDDRRKNQDHIKDPINNDKYFALSEVDKLNKLLIVCNDNHLNYNLILEHWDEKEQEIVNEIYIVSNNCKNY